MGNEGSMSELATRLQLQMAARKLKASDLAALSGHSTGVIEALVRGEPLQRWELLDDLAETLGVEAEELMPSAEDRWLFQGLMAC